MTLVVLSLGSNIEREKNLQFALDEIGRAYGHMEISPVYETVSVGFSGPSFLNFVVGINAHDSVEEVQAVIHDIERRAGRVRGEKTFGDRRLDIDILLFGDADLRASGKNIPRHEIEKYAFVLKPLADLYPESKHPVTEQAFHAMWNDFDQSSQQLELSDYRFRI